MSHVWHGRAIGGSSCRIKHGRALEEVLMLNVRHVVLMSHVRHVGSSMRSSCQTWRALPRGHWATCCTICMNCMVEKTKLNWRLSDIEAFVWPVDLDRLPYREGVGSWGEDMIGAWYIKGAGVSVRNKQLSLTGFRLTFTDKKYGTWPYALPHNTLLLVDGIHQGTCVGCKGYVIGFIFLTRKISLLSFHSVSEPWPH